jgi:SIR2-like domain
MGFSSLSSSSRPTTMMCWRTRWRRLFHIISSCIRPAARTTGASCTGARRHSAGHQESQRGVCPDGRAAHPGQDEWGLDPARELRPNFVVTSRDFVVLAARIPAILPAVIREHMREKSMLFIGHGMAEPDVREFARYAKKERGPRKSWAIQWPEKRDEAYWRASRGVEILKSDRDIYVLSLSRSLESRFGIKT